ncbi:MAG: TldD/PmbA family protein [Candidatus Delongbacteria bacterium]|jgi:PmbA protein|nr:TldD/PmbA family protein [Candidatus Delongbacteria bacterium]
MEKLLQIAMESVDQAEVYFFHRDGDSIKIADGNITEAKSSISSGYTLRVIKNGKIGLANTCNLLDREEFVKNAINSAKSGLKVEFNFPKTGKATDLKTFDPNIKLINKNELIKKVKEVISYIKSKSEAQVNINIGISTSKRRIINSAGTDLKDQKSWFSIYLHLPFPRTYTGISDYLVINKTDLVLDKSKIDAMLDFYDLHKQEIKVSTGKKKIIFMPKAVHSFVKRFHFAISPITIVNKTSPLLDKLGKKIFSDKLTISDNALDDSNLIARTFDGEGVACQNTAFVEKGVLKNIPTDLNYAAKLKHKTTGHGSRNEKEGSVYAGASFYTIAPGDKSLQVMISDIDEGIFVYSLMDAYMAGNYLAGDYSMPVEAAFYIKNGKLIGRVKECMLTGNIYDTLGKIAAIENKNHLSDVGNFPAISFEEINVSGEHKK